MILLLINRLFLFSGIIMANFHPVHYSVTNMDIMQENKKIDLSVKVFTTDIEYAIIHKYDRLIALNDSLTEGTRKLILAYFRSSLQVTVAEQTIDLNLSDIRFQDDSMWLFFTATYDNSSIKSITLTNRILFDLYFDQTNLAIVNTGNDERGYAFNYQNQVFKIPLQ